MFRVMLSVVVVLIMTACGAHNLAYDNINSSKQSKPSITLVPMKNQVGESTAYVLGWDVAEELTSGLQDHVMTSTKMKLALSGNKVARLAKEEGKDLFVDDLAFLKDRGINNVVVMTELLEHRVIPYKRQTIKPLYSVQGEASSVLMMKVRLKIVDMRSGKPRVLLQEILRSNHMIPRAAEGIDYTQLVWGTRIYLKSPLGAAHARLERDLAKRIKDYVGRTARPV